MASPSWHGNLGGVLEVDDGFEPRGGLDGVTVSGFHAVGRLQVFLNGSLYFRRLGVGCSNMSARVCWWPCWSVLQQRWFPEG